LKLHREDHRPSKPGGVSRTRAEPKRVILLAVETKWGGAFRVDHYREQHIRAIDNVFHALDGSGTIKKHRGPLIDVIEAAKDGTGETE